MPRLAFEVHPCPWARLAWALFGLVVAAPLCFSFTPHPAWRVIAASAAVALAWLPAAAILWGRGALAVRRCEWTADGAWHLVRPDGVCETGHLTRATATLGPWILLAWNVGRRRGHPLSRRYALIGVSQVGREAFRTLKGRLSLPAAREAGRGGALTEPVAP